MKTRYYVLDLYALDESPKLKEQFLGQWGETQVTIAGTVPTSLQGSTLKNLLECRRLIEKSANCVIRYVYLSR